MKKAKYIETSISRYGTISEGMSVFRMSRKKLLEEAEKYGALVTISTRMKRIDLDKLSAAFSENYTGGQENE